MPRRNRNVATVHYAPVPDLARTMLAWAGPRSRTVPVKPAAKRRRFRIYGGEL